MNQLIPPACSPLIRDYSIQLRTLLGRNLIGIYLHGSIALNAFDEQTSDIDFVTVTADVLTQAEIQAVRMLHRLRWEEWGRRMEGLYVHHAVAGVPGSYRFPYVQHGQLRSGGHRFPAVAQMILHEHGVVVAGPQPEKIFSAVSSIQLREEMLFNLNVYWAGRLRRPWLFSATAMTEFAVATLPRIIHTLEHGTIISKQRGRALLRDRFPEWSILADSIDSPHHYRRITVAHRLWRAYRVMMCVRAMVRYGNTLYSSSLSISSC